MSTNPYEATGGTCAGRLKGRVAVVTGASKGIGRQICSELAREGADIAAVAGHDLAGAAAAVGEVEQLDRRGIALQADVRRKDQVDDMIAKVAARFERIDILVNNAGGGGVGTPLEHLSAEDWDNAFALNARSTFLCSAAAARHMIPRRSGVIINIAGASAHRTYPRFGGFGPSKAAVVSLTRQASLEWAPYGIRVNGVSPGPIRDPDTNWQDREPILAEEVSRIPLGRAGSRYEVARAVVYLSCDEAAYITGHMLIVDGGGVHTWYLANAIRSGTAAPYWGEE